MRNNLVSRVVSANFWVRPSLLSFSVFCITLTVILIGGVFTEFQNRSIHLQSSRATVSEQLGLVRARLEGNINSNLQLVRGLVALIATQPDIDQTQF